MRTPIESNRCDVVEDAPSDLPVFVTAVLVELYPLLRESLDRADAPISNAAWFDQGAVENVVRGVLPAVGREDLVGPLLEAVAATADEGRISYPAVVGVLRDVGNCRDVDSTLAVSLWWARKGLGE